MVLSPGAVPDPHGYFRGDRYGPREVTRVKTPEKELARRAERQQKARERMEVRETKQILFGDTHVHTTYSTDAFRFSLPFWQGSRGAFPPADACDYARYVSQIDFYFLTDHAESYAPEQWRDAVESVRQCQLSSNRTTPFTERTTPEIPIVAGRNGMSIQIEKIMNCCRRNQKLLSLAG